MAPTFTIGRLAHATGVSAKTIRYYEQVGVLPVPGRSRSGYRQYTERGVDRLLFVHRARVLGLSLRDVTALSAALDGPPDHIRPRLRAAVRAHLVAVQRQLVELGRLQEQLEAVLHRLSTSPRRGRAGGRCRCLDVART
jgi:DNA-binding transcriptional MerR regulator